MPMMMNYDEDNVRHYDNALDEIEKLIENRGSGD